MPERTKVDKVYKALLREGKSEESAARIAQAQTGEALATGKPPKHENAYHIADEPYYHLFVMDPKTHKSATFSYKTVRDRQDAINDYKSKGWRIKTAEGSNSFQNGRTRAMQEIQNKAEKIGIKL
jgi:hypothetical protein